MSVPIHRTGGRGLLFIATMALVISSLPVVGVRTAQAADPAFIHVSTTGNWIEFFNFTPEVAVEVSVDGVLIDELDAASDRFVVEYDLDFEAGQTITATQNAIVVEVTLVGLSIQLVGFEAFGSGPPEASLMVEAFGSLCEYGEHSTLEVTTGEAGDWMASFEADCPDGFGDETYGSVFHFDAEGDATIVETASPGGIEPDEIGDDVTLTEDHEGGFVVVSDDVTLDCAGHRIYGGPEDGVVIEGRTGVTVKNCVFEGFGIAVLLWDSHGNTIENNVAQEPMEFGHGITLFFSDNNTLTGNTLFSSNEALGFVLVDSDSNTYTDNTAESSGGQTGFHILGSSSNRFADNVIEGYELGFTIESAPWEEIYHGSDNNTFTGNQLRNNRVVGFFLAKADGNHFSENLVRNSIIGIGLGQGEAMTPEATNNAFTENVIRDNEVGYANWFNTTGNTVNENRFCHNNVHVDDTNDTETVFAENKFCGPPTK